MEVSCSLVSLSYAASFLGYISRQNDSLFDRQSKLSRKLGTLISLSNAFDHKIGNLLQRVIILAFGRLLDKVHLRGWGCV